MSKTWPRAELHLSPDCPVATHDPIFLYREDAEPRQIGHVLQVTARAGGLQQAQAVLYPHAPADLSCAEVTFHATPQSLEWVVETMLPPAKRALIMEELRVAMQRHQDELLCALRPVMEQGLRDAIGVLQDDLPKSLEAHREELRAIGGRYQRDIVEEGLLPIVQDEVWPVARKHVEPVAIQVGQELWQRVSVWRFGWRYLYDRSPLPERNLFRQEWERYVREEAAPVLQAHTSDFIRVVQQIVAESLRNPRMQGALRDSFLEIMQDPELQRLVGKVVREAVVDNPRLKQVLDRHWQELRRAVSVVAAKLEPTVRRIGDLLFGTREDGITPEFARVLRNQVLLKDKRWLAVRLPAQAGGAPSAGHKKPASGSLRFDVCPGPAAISNQNPFPLGMGGRE